MTPWLRIISKCTSVHPSSTDSLVYITALDSLLYFWIFLCRVLESSNSLLLLEEWLCSGSLGSFSGRTTFCRYVIWWIFYQEGRINGDAVEGVQCYSDRYFKTHVSSGNLSLQDDGLPLSKCI